MWGPNQGWRWPKLKFYFAKSEFFFIWNLRKTKSEKNHPKNAKSEIFSPSYFMIHKLNFKSTFFFSAFSCNFLRASNMGGCAFSRWFLKWIVVLLVLVFDLQFLIREFRIIASLRRAKIFINWSRPGQFLTISRLNFVHFLKFSKIYSIFLSLTSKVSFWTTFFAALA